MSPQAADAPNCHPSEPPWRHVQGSKRRTLQVSQLDHPKQRQEKWKTSPRLPLIEKKKGKSWTQQSNLDWHSFRAQLSVMASRRRRTARARKDRPRTPNSWSKVWKTWARSCPKRRAAAVAILCRTQAAWLSQAPVLSITNGVKVIP